MISKAPLSEVAPFYHRYLQQIPEGDILVRLQEQADDISKLLTSLSSEKQNFAYKSGKWTVKELFGHMIDTERIMAYRALCIARGEKQSLPGFEENDYVAAAQFSKREINSLLQEYQLQRHGNITLFASFDETTLQRAGTMNNNNATVRGILTIIAAHEFHHLQILKDRYQI
ncbi:DinB family protein [Adhaeribacter radiodurans]|uniref:DinB family protein n=1 Tax=Adhaeribacter radiodurans TaxID=2745197 RepID=A0A7L7L6N9_9BACT|nr:DinB family protein [Adhaeribacter radiodurans]QMU28467.1 DinB family protein [Adhaeribacter radiodurans]